MSVVDPDDHGDKQTKKQEYRDLDEEQAELERLAPSNALSPKNLILTLLPA